MSRLAVMAHYDPRGGLGPHVRRQVLALASSVDELVVVSTAALGQPERAWLAQHGRVIVRANFGYDFYSYKVGLESSPNLVRHDEVILCNDTCVGPLVPYSTIFETMSTRPVDFWGFSASERNGPHLQSFFVAFRSWVVGSRAFETFWRDLVPIDDRLAVIHRYEIGLTRALARAGFVWAPYFTENERDRSVARRRVAWWALHRQARPQSRRRAVRHVAKAAREPWNPAIGLADVALDGGRLPYVKLDTLRYDPYGLGADKLLTLCERRFGAEFDGVRALLEETADLYPTRVEERLRPTPPLMRPLRRLVEYGHGT